MRFLLDVHRRSHAALAIVGTTALCSSLAAILILFVNMDYAKTELLAETRSFAKVLSLNFATSLAYNDEQFAREILAKLSVHSSVSHACLYKTDGSLFVSSDDKSVECPAHVPAETETPAAISVPIRQNDVQLGSLVLYISDLRVTNFRQHIIWPSVGIILGFILLFVVPFSALIQRLISRPVRLLVSNAQALIPDRSNDPNNLLTALQIVEMAREQLLNATDVIRWSAYKIDRTVENYNLSLQIIKEQLQISYDVANTNQILSSNNQLGRNVTNALLGIARDEIEKSFQSVGRLETLMVRQKNFLANSPHIGQPHMMLLEAFEEYFGKFLCKKIQLEIEAVEGTAIKFFLEEYRAFLYCYFALCDLLTTPDISATICFSSQFKDAEEKTLACSLMLRSTEPMLIMPMVDEDEDPREPILEVTHEHKVKEGLEKIKFFANLNARKADMTMVVSERTIQINFYIDKQ